MSNFNNDIKVESEIGKFLDKNYYPTVTGGSFERVTDLKLQRKGVDVLFINDNKQICYIDEKAAIHFFKVHSKKTNLKTFAFELMNTKSGNIGWFLNDNLFTEVYNLIYGEADCDTWFDVSSENITNITMYCLEKKKLKEYLSSKFNIDDDLLNHFKDYISSKYNEINASLKFYIHTDSEGNFHVFETKYKLGYNLLTDKVCFCYSGQIPEKPINLLIDREILKECSTGVVEVNNKGQINCLKS